MASLEEGRICMTRPPLSVRSIWDSNSIRITSFVRRTLNHSFSCPTITILRGIRRMKKRLSFKSPLEVRTVLGSPKMGPFTRGALPPRERRGIIIRLLKFQFRKKYWVCFASQKLRAVLITRWLQLLTVSCSPVVVDGTVN